MDVSGKGYNNTLSVCRESHRFFYAKDATHTFYRHLWFAAAGLHEPERRDTPATIKMLCAMRRRIKDKL